MKKTRKIAIAMLLAISVLGEISANAQESAATTETKKEITIKEMLETRQFVFIPQSVIPTDGRMRQLTSYYDLTLRNDTLISFLPYFGRAFTAPVNPRKSELDFTSTDFDYELQEKKKGGWDITVKPKDQPGVRRLMFTIFDNGAASLRVNNNNSQPISFNGHITAPELRK